MRLLFNLRVGESTDRDQTARKCTFYCRHVHRLATDLCATTILLLAN